ncbi:MAG: AMP-binding protein, partial [Ectothiorhodospiraceae bacterium]|nr:AMP-binding protein [Ectothiorhodospiraceae bacterium]
ITPGYWKRPDATREAIEAEGWLHSGDVARCDEDGYYFIVDRWKDMYISGGENVYPAEVEQVLQRHPAVAEVAVVGVQDERWGEVGKAFLVASANVQRPDDAELKRYCREKLAGYKVPVHFQWVGALPRNALGKIQKGELRNG